MVSSEIGFYAFAFLLSLFGGITVQKNIRDSQDIVVGIEPAA